MFIIFRGPRYKPVAVFYEHGNELLDSVTADNLLAR
jgi:hypothetical protein